MNSYLTANIPGTGGTIKESPEDFQVTELPLYLPCGTGEHTYAEIEKRGVPTLDALRRIARALEVSDRDLGYAGMKDARGITRQTVSIPRVDPQRVLDLELPGIKVLTAMRHTNKLKLGHLAGNRFHIRLRDVDPHALESAGAVLRVLVERGVPNRFGEQRYGAQGNSHQIGGAWLRGDHRGAVDALMGEPELVRDERWQAAIASYRRGELEESLRLFPGHCRTERDVLQRLIKHPEAWSKALNAVHPRLKKLYLSAYQSFLFDRLLEARLEGFDRVMAGDLAFKHDSGACFIVTEPAAEAPRAERFEISPTGPLFGCKMKSPEGVPGAMEASLLAGEGLTPASFDLPGGMRLEGARRPLRVPLGEPVLEEHGDDLVLDFSLPKGSYATAVLQEIIKPGRMDT